MKNQFRKARNHSSSAYERIKETDVSKIASMVAMLKRALRNKLEVDYVLMDSWFTCWEVVSLIIKRKGLHLIGMYKGAKTKFDYMGKSLTYSQVRNELGNPIRCRRLLGKCQSTDFDAQIADTTMVMIRYMMASLKYRFDNYWTKTIGRLLVVGK
jgi:hypothetical protein